MIIKNVIGVDEVGRGCVAGPVVAAAVAWNNDIEWVIQICTVKLADSKKLTSKKRDAFDTLIRSFTTIGVGSVSVANINKLNILQASREAMWLAVEDLRTKHTIFKPSIIIVDGDYEIPYIKEKQRTQQKADATVPAVMAASIIAKVFRDNLMCDYHKQYPKYGWTSNKGYCTEWHIKAIKKYGLTPLHRNYKKFLDKIGVKYDI